jgi:hypothetical protein
MAKTHAEHQAIYYAKNREKVLAQRKLRRQERRVNQDWTSWGQPGDRGGRLDTLTRTEVLRARGYDV